MTLLAFQQTLAALVASPDARRRAAAGDESGWPEALDARELVRLRALARDPGLRTGTLIHRSFRLSMLSSSLPRSCKALGPQAIKALTHAFWREHPPRSLLYRREALRFAAYALPRLRAGEFASAWLPEVLEAEVAALELLELLDLEPAAATDPTTPRVAPDSRIIRFRRAPLAVMSALGSGRLPEDEPQGEHYLAVQRTSAGRIEWHALAAEEGRARLALEGRVTADLGATLAGRRAPGGIVR